MSFGVTLVAAGAESDGASQYHKVDSHHLLTAETVANGANSGVTFARLRQAADASVVLLQELTLASQTGGSFGGGTSLGLVTRVEPYRFAYTRGTTYSQYATIGIITVDPNTFTMTFVAFTSALWTAGSSYLSNAGSAAGILGVDSLPGQGVIFPGMRPEAVGVPRAKDGYDGFLYMTWPPDPAGFVIDAVGGGFGVVDPWVQMASDPVAVDTLTSVVTLRHFDSAGVFTRHTMVVMRGDATTGLFGYGTPVEVATVVDSFGRYAGAPRIRPLADGRLLLVWVEGTDVHFRYATTTGTTSPQLVLGAEVVVAQPFYAPFTGDPTNLVEVAAWNAGHPGNPAIGGWAMTADELTVVVPIRRPNAGVGGGYTPSARRLRRNGDTWGYVVDDTEHPVLNSTVTKVVPLRELREDFAVQGPGTVSLLRVGFVADDIGGVVGMVPSAG